MTEQINKSTLDKDEKTNLNKIVKETLSQYFDIKTYDTIKNKQLLRQLWDIKYVKELHNVVQPSVNYFINDFNFKDYRTLDHKNKIVKTFKINVNV